MITFITSSDTGTFPESINKPSCPWRIISASQFGHAKHTTGNPQAIGKTFVSRCQNKCVIVFIDVLIILFDHDKSVSGNIDASIVAQGQHLILIGKTQKLAARCSQSVTKYVPGTAVYRRRQPERTAVYQMVQGHLETWLSGKRRVLRLPHTSSRISVNISNLASYNNRRMVETAAYLVDQAIPQVPVRQWVLSFPKRLRYFLAHDANLLECITDFSEQRGKGASVLLSGCTKPSSTAYLWAILIARFYEICPLI